MTYIRALYLLSIFFLMVARVPASIDRFISVSQESIGITVNSLRMDLDPASGTISKMVNLENYRVVSRGQGGIYLLDGETGETLTPKRLKDIRLEGNTLSFRMDYGTPDISVNNSLRVGALGALWTVNIHNTGKRRRLYEIRLGLPVDFSRTSYDYWDGYDHPPDSPTGRPFSKCNADTNRYAINALPASGWKAERPGPVFSRNMIIGNVCIFPMNCLWNEDIGVAVGASPFQALSYYSGGVQPALSSFESFYYAMKVVIDPGECESRDFVLLPFRARGGYRAGLKRYYEMFPAAFERRGDISPRVMLPATGGFLGTGINVYEYDLRALWAEFCRRYYVGWVWLYAPFQETGEWFPSPDTYTLEGWKQRSGKRKRSHPDFFAQRMGTYEACVSYFSKIVGCLQKAASVGWYIIPQRCSKRLAEQYYPDAIVNRWNKGRPYFMNSGPSGHPQYTVCALNNRLEVKTKQDIAKILTLTGVEGIAFDNALAFECYTGKSADKAEGWAFRDGKPYAANYLAYRELEGYVRSFEHRSPDGYRPAVFTNGPFNMATAERTDASLIEYHPYFPANMRSSFAMLRYLLGPEKPISFKVHGRTSFDCVARDTGCWRDSIETVYNERLHSLLALFRWGAFPRISEALGNSDIITALPVLIRLFNAGWQAEPLIQFDPDHLWVERFGKGVRTLFSIINYNPSHCTDELTLDVAFGRGLFFFESLYGDPIESVSSGQSSEIKLSIRPVWLSAISAFLHVTPETTPERMSATIDHGYDDGRKKASIHLSAYENCVAELEIPIQHGALDARVNINGAPIEVTSSNGVIRCRSQLEKENDIEISYLEEISMAPNPRAILSCDFTDTDIHPWSIRITDGSLRKLAEKIRAYFFYYTHADQFERFYQSNGRTPVPDKQDQKLLPIVRGTGGPPVNQISLEVDAALKTKGRLSLVLEEGRYLLKVSGRSEQDLERAVMTLLRLLDEEYVRYGYDGILGRPWSEPGTLSKAIPGCRRMGWFEFLNYKRIQNMLGRYDKMMNDIATWWPK